MKKLSEKIKYLLFALLVSVSSTAFSQNIAINLTGAPSGNPSAILDLAANSNLGFLMPKVSLVSTTDVATIPTPATGLIVWNTNAAMTGGLGVGFYYYDGAHWQYVYNSGSAIGNFINNQTTVQAGANFNIGANGLIGGTLGVTGATTLSNTLSVAGASTQTGAVQHVGTTALNGATTLGTAGTPGN